MITPAQQFQQSRNTWRRFVKSSILMDAESDSVDLPVSYI
jgi:hypothetical protein